MFSYRGAVDDRLVAQVVRLVLDDDLGSSLRIPDLARLDREELEDLVAEAWLTRAQKRVAKAWLAEHAPADDQG